MQKRYAGWEKLLYANPKEEASFLSGAFQTVSYGAASVVAGPIIALAALLVTHKTFAEPYRNAEKPVRQAHFRGFAAGLVLSMAVGMAVDHYFSEDNANSPAPDMQEFSALGGETGSSRPQHSQSGPAHI